MHNKCKYVHCSRMLMWCSLLLLVAITVINMCALHTNVLCRCLQMRKILKNTQQELQNTMCDALACFKIKSSCTVSLIIVKPIDRDALAVYAWYKAHKMDAYNQNIDKQLTHKLIGLGKTANHSPYPNLLPM